MEEFLLARIREIKLDMEDQIHKYGGRGMKTFFYVQSAERLRDNERFLAIVRGDMKPGEYYQ